MHQLRLLVLIIVNSIGLSLSAQDVDAKKSNDLREDVIMKIREQVSQELPKVKAAIIEGRYLEAQGMLEEILIFNPGNLQAQELQKLNKKFFDQTRRLKGRQRFVSDPLKVSERMANGDGHLGSLLRHQLKGPRQKASWVFFNKRLKSRIDLSVDAQGSDILKKIAKSLDINIATTRKLRKSEAFQESLELDLKSIKAKSLLDYLAQEWGALWVIQDEMILFAIEYPDRGPTVPDGYQPPDFDTLDLGRFGLESNLGFGINSQSLQVVPNSRIGSSVLSRTPILIEHPDKIGVLVNPQTIKGGGSQKK